MKTLQSSNLPLELSFDNGVSWQLLTCLTQYNIPLDKAANTVETFCGPAVGIGTKTFNPTGTAVANLEPTAGSQVSYKELVQAWDSEQIVKFRVRYPTGSSTGSNFFLQGDSKVTNLNITAQAGQLVQFDFTLTGEGDLDVTA